MGVALHREINKSRTRDSRRSLIAHWTPDAKIALRMLSENAQRVYTFLLALFLASAVLSRGGLARPNWYVCLVLLALINLIFWLNSRAVAVTAVLPRLVWAAAFALPIFVLFQLVPLPVSVLRFISPAHADLVDRLSRVGVSSKFAAISIAPEITSSYLVRIIACLLVFLVVRTLALQAREHNPWLPVLPLIAIACVEAVMGLIQSANGADSVAGSYGNKNHFAGLLEMTVPLTIAFGLALLNGPRTRSNVRSGKPLAGAVVLLLGGVCIAGLVASISKMGYIACLSGLLVMSAVGLSMILRGWQRWVAALALAGLFTFALVFLPSDELMRAFGSLFADEWTTGEGRWPIFLNTFGLIRAYALVGCGLGTFQTGFLKYQTAVIDRTFTYAHNDYLQLFSELGVLGFLLIAVLMLSIMWRALRVASQPHDRTAGFLALGCVGALTSIGIHSFADFNTYIPANAVVLAWIAGIAASLSVHSNSGRRETTFNGGFLRVAAIALSLALAICAGAWMLFDTRYRNDAKAERLFCEFDICDTSAALGRQAGAVGGNTAALPLGELMHALERDPASPERWCDLGEAFSIRGKAEAARYAFSTAIALGPYVPVVLMRSAHFELDKHEEKRAIQEEARVLERTAAYDSEIFEWFRRNKLPAPDVLENAFTGDARAPRAYLRYWMMLPDSGSAATVWHWILMHSYADEPLARDYVNFLFNAGQAENAAKAWAVFLDGRRGGYLESDWIYNGDFESEPSGLAFDWKLEGLADRVDVTRDAGVSHTGSHALRIQFLSKENVNFAQTFQTAFVRPGAYRFEAFIKTEGITTDEGVGFELSSDAFHVDIKTEKLRGTHDWTRIEETVVIPPGAHLLMIRVIRQPSLKFDNLISGTAWIDSVRLVSVGPEAKAR